METGGEKGKGGGRSLRGASQSLRVTGFSCGWVAGSHIAGRACGHQAAGSQQLLSAVAALPGMAPGLPPVGLAKPKICRNEGP